MKYMELCSALAAALCFFESQAMKDMKWIKNEAPSTWSKDKNGNNSGKSQETSKQTSSRAQSGNRRKTVDPSNGLGATKKADADIENEKLKQRLIEEQRLRQIEQNRHQEELAKQKDKVDRLKQKKNLAKERAKNAENELEKKSREEMEQSRRRDDARREELRRKEEELQLQRQREDDARRQRQQEKEEEIAEQERRRQELEKKNQQKTIRSKFSKLRREDKLSSDPLDVADEEGDEAVEVQRHTLLEVCNVLNGGTLGLYAQGIPEQISELKEKKEEAEKQAKELHENFVELAGPEIWGAQPETPLERVYALIDQYISRGQVREGVSTTSLKREESAITPVKFKNQKRKNDISGSISPLNPEEIENWGDDEVILQLSLVREILQGNTRKQARVRGHAIAERVWLLNEDYKNAQEKIEEIKQYAVWIIGKYQIGMPSDATPESMLEVIGKHERDLEWEAQKALTAKNVENFKREHPRLNTELKPDLFAPKMPESKRKLTGQNSKSIKASNKLREQIHIDKKARSKKQNREEAKRNIQEQIERAEMTELEIQKDKEKKETQLNLKEENK